MSTMHFSNLRLLGVFAIVVESGSFAAAARRLNSSRSRISEQVSDLEKGLNVRLLQRSTRQLNLTEEGKKVYSYARQLPDILNEVESIANPSLPGGKVVITMGHDIANKLFLPLLDDFQARHPNIRLELMLDDECLDLIGEQIDLAVRISKPTESSWVARKLYEESLQIFAHPDYLNSNGGMPKNIAQLSQLRWIILSQKFQDNRVELTGIDNERVEIRPDNYVRCNSPLMMMNMVAQGLGLGVMFPCTICQEIRLGRMVNVMPELHIGPIQFSLIYPSRKQMPARVRALVDFFLAAEVFRKCDMPNDGGVLM